MPPESEEDVLSKPATTRQSETTPARRDPEEAQLDEDLQTTRPSRRRHLPLKYKDFVYNYIIIEFCEEISYYNMDNETVMEFLKKQMDSLAEITKNLSLMNTNSGQNVPKPLPLDVEKDYVIATGMDKWPPSEEEKKIRILFTLIGDKAMFKYDRFKLSDDEKTTVNNVISAIRSRLISKRNVIYERAMFNSCNQETDEKFDDYYRKLEKLIENCEFKDFKSDLLRDRIVLGIKNKELRKRLMTKADLTLRETLDLCRIDELTNQEMQELSTETVNKISNARSFLRKEHVQHLVKFVDHAEERIQKVCKKKKGKKEQIEAKVEKKSRRKKIKSVEGIETGESDEENETYDICKIIDNRIETGESDEENETYDICKIIDNSNIGGKVEAILDFKINKAWKKLSCQLDTGANLQVVNVEHGVLLSASACVSMGLINYCNTIMERNLKDEAQSIITKLERNLKDEAQSIITKYKNVFEGYGCFGNEARLETNPEVKFWSASFSSSRRSEVNVKPRQETEESTSNKETTQNDTHNKLTMPPESEEDVSSKPANTINLQCHPNQKKMCRANQQPQGRAKRPQRGGTLRKLSSTRIYRRRDQVVDDIYHLNIKTL
ncbi:hypothetical protein QE152_g5617 [Popillia japonica]|uniref:Uncharacterized protein n=1 Tax=Popillia japonica TaxID=7064 RepID=A0AAW1MM60_POPJA